MDVVSILRWLHAFVRWFEPAMDVNTILDREYNMVAELKLLSCTNLFLNLAL